MTLERIEDVAKKLDAYNADDEFLPPADAQFAAKALRKLSEFANKYTGLALQDLNENATLASKDYERLCTEMSKACPIIPIVV